MAKKADSIDLTISTKYVKNWGVAEAIREIVANALDAERVLGYAMEFEYDLELMQITVVTRGCILETKTLLLGISEKGGENAIGQHGEGYKLAALALTRAGKSMTIRTGTQVWRSRFKKHPVLGNETVLSFDITELGDEIQEIRYAIGGITADEWFNVKKLFLMKQDLIKTEAVETIGSPSRWKATVLFDPEQVGRMYVGGIFVEKDDRLKFGYDLPPRLVSLDRDRSTVGSALYAIVHVWQGAFVDAQASKSNMRGRFWEILGSGARDVSYLEEGYYVDEEFKTAVISYFNEKHGDDTYVYDTHEDELRLGALAKRGVKLPKPLSRIIAGSRPSIPDLEKRQSESILSTWTIAELPPEKKRRIDDAWELVMEAGQKVDQVSSRADVPRPQIARFASEAIWGLHIKTGEIYISEQLLAVDKAPELLARLVRDCAQYRVYGTDVKQFDIAQLLWTEIVRIVARKFDDVMDSGPASEDDPAAVEETRVTDETYPLPDEQSAAEDPAPVLSTDLNEADPSVVDPAPDSGEEPF